MELLYSSNCRGHQGKQMPYMKSKTVDFIIFVLQVLMAILSYLNK